MASTAPLDSAAASRAAAIGGHACTQRSYGGLTQL